MTGAAPAHAAFRAAILRALSGSADGGYTTGVRVARAARALSMRPCARRQPLTSSIPALSRCYASSSKITLDQLDASEAYQEFDEFFPPPPNPTSRPLPCAVPDAAIPASMDARTTPTASLAGWDSAKSQPPPPLPLSTYDTSFSRVTAFQRKSRRRQVLREEGRADRQRMLKWGQPSTEFKVTEELSSRAKNVFSDLHREGVLGLAQQHTRVVSLCRTLIVRGQLLQGMTLLLQLFEENIDAKAYIGARFEGEERASMRSDRIISPQDVSALASDISRVLTANVQINRSKDTHIPPWRPASVPDDVDHLELPAQLLCAHALASLFDKTVLLGYDPPHAVSAILLSCFSQSMVEANFTSALGLITELYGFKEMGTAVLSAALSGYGRFSKSAEGEMFLRDYAFAHVSRGEAHSEQSTYCPTSAYRLEGCPVPLNGWSQSGAVWTSVIRSKVVEGDMQDAERWLQLYRQIRDECKRGHLSQELCPPGSCNPYLTIMSGYEWASVSREAQSKFNRLDTQIDAEGDWKTMEVLRMLKADEIPFTTQMMSFVAKFARRRARTQSAVDSLKIVSDMGRGGATDKAKIAATEKNASTDLEGGSAQGTHSAQGPVKSTAASISNINSHLHARSEQATQMAHRLLASSSTPSSSEIVLEIGPNWDSHTFSEMFDMLKFSKVSDDGLASGDSILAGRQVVVRLQDSKRSASRLPLRSRVLFQIMISQHLSSTKGNMDRRSIHITPPVLYKALRCALDERYRDYPLALAILQTFRLCNLQVDTYRLMLLITKAMEVELEGDAHNAELLFMAAGLREDSGHLREWQWKRNDEAGEYDVYDGRRWVGRGGASSSETSAAVQEMQDGRPSSSSSTSTSTSPTPSSSDVKITSMLSLKNLLRWATVERIRTSIEGRVSHDASETPWEWDWTRYAPDTLHEQYRKSLEATQHDEANQDAAANLPKKVMAGTTEHEFNLTFACLKEVWNGVFELTVRRQDRRKYTCDWEEDEIMRVRVINSDKKRAARDEATRSLARERSTSDRGDSSTDGRRNEPGAAQADAAVAAPVRRGRGRPRKDASGAVVVSS